jgi:hypothetical protein
MKPIPISAEVEPLPGQGNAAALSLQRLGFRIQHIGSTISVQGAKRVWESTFGVLFRPATKPATQNVKGGEASYFKAVENTVHIPEKLQAVIANVVFVEPPEFFESSGGEKMRFSRKLRKRS